MTISQVAIRAQGTGSRGCGRDGDVGSNMGRLTEFGPGMLHYTSRRTPRQLMHWNRGLMESS
jgi:hypothetical protein